jgi:hypothetical protein
MNVLIAGIPSPGLLSHIRKEYGEDLVFFVAESRPFEEHVAREVAAVKDAGYRITLCTDNMIGSLMNECDIDVVWSLSSSREGDVFTAINGARMAAVLAQEHAIPFMLFPYYSLPQCRNGVFHGRPVTVKGVGYIEHELEVVRADLVAEAV